MIRRAAAALVAVAAVLGPGAAPADAHEAGTTGVELEVGAESAEVVFDLPLEPMESALGLPIADDTFGLSLQRESIVAYVADHLEVTTADETWPETFGRLTSIRAGGVRSLRLEATVESPTGTNGFTFAYDGLIEDDAEQLVFVTVLDEQGSVTLAGVLDSASSEILVGGPIDTSTWSVVVTMVREGFHHVLAGADHMLFLLMLLIPAPLVASHGRWRVGDGSRPAVRKVVHVATAFTVGHSTTLVASALGWVTMPTRTVEVAIGLSVAASAVHATRPVIASGEVWIAGGFGMVHGLAFATILDGLDLRSTPLLSLLGFNLGVEVAQLTIVALTFPSLYVLSRRRIYPPIRIGAAAMASIAATGWVIERVGIIDSPFGAIESAIVDHLGWVVGVLALGALFSARFGRVGAACAAAVLPQPAAMSAATLRARAVSRRR